MHLHSVEAWTHTHDYTTSAQLSAERRTRWVVYLTLATMVVELVASRACIVSLVTHDPRPLEHYKALIDAIPGIGHLTIEVNRCSDRSCHAR